jgi:hypothetical protein
VCVYIWEVDPICTIRYIHQIEVPNFIVIVNFEFLKVELKKMFSYQTGYILKIRKATKRIKKNRSFDMCITSSAMDKSFRHEKHNLNHLYFYRNIKNCKTT